MPSELYRDLGNRLNGSLSMIHIEGGEVGGEELVEEREWGLLKASTRGGSAVEISRICLK
jgi:hypothetical protein